MIKQGERQGKGRIYIFSSRYGWIAFIRSSALLTPNGRG